MKRYEHKVQTAELSTRAAAGDDPADLLSWKGCALGLYGWELISVVVDPVRGRLLAYFQRELDSEIEPPPVVEDPVIDTDETT